MWKGNKRRGKKRKRKEKKNKETKPRPNVKEKEKKKKKNQTQKPNLKRKKKKKDQTKCEREKRKKKRRRQRMLERAKGLTGFDYSLSLWLWVPQICVYLPKRHHNFVSITQKHLKFVLSFHDSSLKNQRIEWRKQKLKINPNKLNNRGTHQFWVMSDENRLMGDGKH